MSEGKTYTQIELAKELNVSVETAQCFIEYLTERGLLSKVEYYSDKSSCLSGSNQCEKCKRCAKRTSFENKPILFELKKKNL